VLVGYSGLRLTQAARPSMAAAAQRAFRPALTTGLKASAARFASTDAALHGKIHQVIGAVVDGMRKFFPTARPSFISIEASVRWVPIDLERLLTYHNSQVRYRQASSDSQCSRDDEW
jgi:hypothetical protein